MKKIFLKIYFFFRNYLNETISFFIAIAGAVLAYFFYQEPQLQFASLIVLAFTSYLIIVFLKLKSRDFYYIFFDKYDDKEGWVGSGVFEFYPNDEAFLIRDSDAGFIFSKCLNWIDYEVNCEFKILKNTLGILVRATDLSNKLMMQLNIDANGIRPHLWANGGYIVQEPKESRLEFETSLKEGRWYKLLMHVYKDSMKIQILENGKSILEKHWDIPTALLSFPIREKDKNQGDTKNPIGMLDIRKDYSYGTVGFRNGHGEKALVRNLLIRKI
jgi:hypothetical protein